MGVSERKDLRGANLKGADLKGTRNLSFDQLSKVKTLYDTKLDEELHIPLKKKYPAFLKCQSHKSSRIKTFKACKIRELVLFSFPHLEKDKIFNSIWVAQKAITNKK